MKTLLLRTGILACQFIGLGSIAIGILASTVGCRLEDAEKRQERERLDRLRHWHASTACTSTSLPPSSRGNHGKE